MLAISVDGTVRIEGPGGPVSVVGTGDRVVVRLPGVYAVWQWARRARGMGEILLTWTTRAGVNVDVAVARRVVAETGPHIKNSPIARILGLPPAKIRWMAVLAALLRRNGEQA